MLRLRGRQTNGPNLEQINPLFRVDRSRVEEEARKRRGPTEYNRKKANAWQATVRLGLGKHKNIYPEASKPGKLSLRPR